MVLPLIGISAASFTSCEQLCLDENGEPILDENYEFMVVGYPDNTFGWIMARGTSMNNDIYDNILETLERDFGYSKETFQKVIHKN